MKAAVVWILASAIAASVGVAAAATVGLATARTGAGDTAIVACDDAFTVSYTTSGGKVTVVTVGGIADPGCEGGALSLSLTNVTGDSIASPGPQAVSTDGDSLDNSLALATTPQPNADQVAGIVISVVGP